MDQNNTQTSPTQNNQDEKLIFESGIFWKKSKWNATETVPVVLKFTNKSLSMMDRDGNLVFNLAPSEFTFKLTRLGNFYIITKDTTYNFVGIGSIISSTFSDKQLEELRKNIDYNPYKDKKVKSHYWYQNTNVYGAPEFDIINEYPSLKYLKKNPKLWNNVFRSNGVKVIGKNTSITLLVTLPILIILGFFALVFVSMVIYFAISGKTH